MQIESKKKQGKAKLTLQQFRDRDQFVIGEIRKGLASGKSLV